MYVHNTLNCFYTYLNYYKNKQQFHYLSETRGELEQMKKFLIFPIWVLGALFATSIYATESQSFTMTGERIVVDGGYR